MRFWKLSLILYLYFERKAFCSSKSFRRIVVPILKYIPAGITASTEYSEILPGTVWQIPIRIMGFKMPEFQNAVFFKRFPMQNSLNFGHMTYISPNCGLQKKLFRCVRFAIFISKLTLRLLRSCGPETQKPQSLKRSSSREPDMSPQKNHIAFITIQYLCSHLLVLGVGFPEPDN